MKVRKSPINPLPALFFTHKVWALLTFPSTHDHSVANIFPTPMENCLQYSSIPLDIPISLYPADELHNLENHLMSPEGEDNEDVEKYDINLRNIDMEMSQSINGHSPLETEPQDHGGIGFSQKKTNILGHSLENEKLNSRVINAPQQISAHNPTNSFNFPGVLHTDHMFKSLDHFPILPEGREFQDWGSFNTNLNTPYMDMLRSDIHIKNGWELENQKHGDNVLSLDQVFDPTHLIKAHTYQSNITLQHPSDCHNIDFLFGKFNNNNLMENIQIPGQGDLNMYEPNMKQMASPFSWDNGQNIVDSLYSENHSGGMPDNSFKSDDIEDVINQQFSIGKGGQKNTKKGGKSLVKTPPTRKAKKNMQEAVTRKRKSNNYEDGDSQGNPKKSTNSATTHQPKYEFDTGGFTLTLFLQYQGMLEMGVHDGVTSNFSRILKEIHEMWSVKIKEEKDCDQEHIKRLERTFDRVENSVVKAFFGAIGVLYRLHKDKITKARLISEGCIFLSSFLGGLKKVPRDEVVLLASRKYTFSKSKWQWKTATELLYYIISLNDDSTTAHGAILQLTERFIGFLSSQEIPLFIRYDHHHFTTECHNIHHKRDYIHKLQVGRLYNPTTKSPNHTGNKKRHGFPINTNTKLIPKITKNSSRAFNISIATEFLIKKISFSSGIETYFKDLIASLVGIVKNSCPEILDDLQERVIIQQYLRRPNSKRAKIELTPDRLMDSLIRVAHLKITALFLYSLEVYHKHQTRFNTLQSSLEDGWRFLRKYFDTWKDGIRVQEGSYTPKARAVDWSNVHAVIIYFLTWVTDAKPPYLFVRYLCDQWANEIDGYP